MAFLSFLSSPRTVRRSWPVASLLTGCGLAACLICIGISASRGVRAVGATAAVMAVLVLVILEFLRRHYRDAVSTVAQLKQQMKAREAEFGRRIEGLEAAAGQQVEDLNAQWRTYAESQSRTLEEMFGHLAQVQLPVALRGSSPVPPSLHNELMGKPVGKLVDQVLTVAASAGEDSREREESSRVAVVALSERVQTMAHLIQQLVSQLRPTGNW